MSSEEMSKQVWLKQFVIFGWKSVICKTNTLSGISVRIDTFKRNQFWYPLKFQRKARRMTWKDSYSKKDSHLMPRQRLLSNNTIWQNQIKYSNHSNKENICSNLSLSMKMSSNWLSNRWLKKSFNAMNLTESTSKRDWSKRWSKKRQNTVNS